MHFMLVTTMTEWNVEDQTRCVKVTPLDSTEIVFDTTMRDFPSSNSSSSCTPSVSSTDSSSTTVDLSVWPENFEVPWNRMPSGIKTAIALGKRPTAKDRREMIRIVVDEMRLTELNPSKSQCLIVAKKIVKQYSQSFADVLVDGTRIGTGYGSLLTQLKTRVEHVNRGCLLSRRRTQKKTSNSSGEDIAPGPADQYGCVRWQPECPQEESEESLQEKQKEMKDLYSTEGPAGVERGHLSQLMKATYYLQRKSINACPSPSIADLKNDWPYLFTPKELYNHFKSLTNITILEKLEKSMEEKGKMILQFFRQLPAGTNTDEMQRILMKYDDSGASCLIPCVVLLLLSHFKEKPEALFLQTDWMLSVEGQVVMNPHPNFMAGFAALFATYYNFNLVYQHEASCTLEFVQRCFVGINPSTGTKTVREEEQHSQSSCVYSSQKANGL
ncbi:uncharacterized protein LOC131541152 [Onychostoma macrolepis]|uniref:Uncharacterized protein n=1 Tax=Onychostoma macrolepis TaxID=369639 RepID=A0A7J6D420_9TELE|nr:uncharacterized protein LOC131541152 [Onychostoma macrolepis]XP_058632703.1 uncharacterized protein LOC131541152 [Onychostoma macrolepis]XP_058632704.1 uncharacterized protein LOC131541152 [Onychostoma macrolepis]XP_058632705.1 uncharacterized protein LOC131541152 [Onychostoma macrolepis]KAF4113966.1 hypothetical protein G5714_006511 [Onychostoma macrolepis]